MSGSVLHWALDSLIGRVVIVTGGGCGLGRSIAEGFISEGCRVAITGHNPDRLEAATSEMGGEVMAHAAKEADEDQVEAACAAAVARWGRIYALVNNARINQFYKRAEHTTRPE